MWLKSPFGDPRSCQQKRNMPKNLLALGYLSPLTPNPSLKRSANGRPRWPSSAGASPHFALAVQRVLPLSPA